MTLARANVPGEYYHVFNRGIHKRTLFHDQADYARFLFCITHFQSSAAFLHIGRIASTFSNDIGFLTPEQEFQNVVEGRTVELVGFCIMPNHFHLIVRELVEGSLSRYLQRVELAYTKYCNAKYSGSGHVFQGRYQAVHVSDNEQLTYLSAYIHRNPRELKAWKGKEEVYPWSSLRDYISENRWGGLLAPEIILDQFDGTTNSNYANFVKSSTAKILEEELAALPTPAQ